MNGDTREEAEQLAKEAGAIIRCPICHEYEISADDGDAESRAYAMATNAWKSGVGRGFRAMDRENVLAVMKSVLSVSANCPRCSFMDRD